MWLLAKRNKTKKNNNNKKKKKTEAILWQRLKMVHVKTSWMKKTEAKIIPVTCLTALSSVPGFKRKQNSSKIHMLWPFCFVYGIGGYVGVFPFHFLQRSLILLSSLADSCVALIMEVFKSLKLPPCNFSVNFSYMSFALTSFFIVQIICFFQYLIFSCWFFIIKW